jgi:SNF2 family DNA or RNA helicase
VSKPWSPRPYQEEGLKFTLARHGSGLLLDPGLGKTSTYLAAICVLRDRKEVRRTLVSAPLRVAQTVWVDEIDKWEDFKHLKIADLTERTDWEREQLLKMDFDIYTINPESTHKVLNPDQLVGIHADVPNRWGIDHFIADESTRWADTSTKRFKAIKPVLGYFKYRNCATGTPTPNGLHQLFGQAQLLDDGAALGKYITHFRQMYMHAHPFIPHVYEMNHGADERIYSRVADLFLRMRAKDHLEMPELIENKIIVRMPSAIQKKYDEFERDFLIKLLDKEIPAFNKASLAVKLRQLSNGFIYHQEEGKARQALPAHDAKLDALGDLLEQMQERPLLLMYEFIEDGRRIQERFPFAVNFTGTKDAGKIVRDFNAGRIRLLIAHPRSAGHGLNLQEACHDICWYGVTWDLELWIQAIARVWRQGQMSSFVMNHIIMCEDTVDSGVLEGMEMKEVTQDNFDQALINYAREKLR